MENLKNKLIAADKQVRIIVICIVIFHLILAGLVASAQTWSKDTFSPNNFLTASTQAARVKEIYTSQIGVREKGINAGPEVEKYLKYVGLAKGNPWCAAFVCWSLGKAGVENPRTGWSPALFGNRRIIWASGEQGTKSKEQRLVGSKLEGLFQKSVDGIDPAGPGAGDVFGLYFPEKGRIAHVGFVDEWKEAWVTTVEGNTNVVGSREGDGVYRKRRLVRSLYRVARYMN